MFTDLVCPVCNQQTKVLFNVTRYCPDCDKKIIPGNPDILVIHDDKGNGWHIAFHPNDHGKGTRSWILGPPGSAPYDDGSKSLTELAMAWEKLGAPPGVSGVTYAKSKMLVFWPVVKP